MFRIKGFGLGALFSLILLSVPQLFGQAVFGVSSSTAIGTDIGYAELTGRVTLTVQSGGSATGSIQILYSAPIANNSAAEIGLSGSIAGLATSPTLDYTSNTITFTVPAGGGVGSTIIIAGARVRLAGSTLSRVTATVSSIGAGGNTIAAGQNTVTVIDRVLQPFSVDYCCAIPLSWVNGQITNPATTFIIREGFPSAFTASSSFGQTTNTQLRITPFPAIPPGIKLTFHGSFTSRESTASFTTRSGTDEVVPRSDGSTSVVYTYGGALNSENISETFIPEVTIASIEAPATTGTITFQVALLPIDDDPPGPGVPIPRYDERLVPEESTLVTGSTDLAFPFRVQSDGTYTGIAITNPQSFQVDLTLTAYDASGNLISGSGITNPTNLKMPRQGQIGMLATEIFGPNFNAASGGTIRVHGKSSTLEGFYLIGDNNGPRLDGATADLNPLQGWILPAVFHQAPSPSTLIELFNPQTASANSTIRLKDSTGKVLSTVSVTLPPNGSMATDISKIFPDFNPASFSGGYIVGGTDVPIIARESFGNALDTNVLAGQWSIQRPTILVAHYATGGGYTTELNIVNVDGAATAKITVTAFDNNGTPLTNSNNPAVLSIPAGTQLTQTMNDLYPGLGSSLLTGYLKLDVASFSQGPFVTVPLIVGSVRFSAADGYASASLPLFLAPAKDFVYSHVAQNQGYFTGIALLNNNATTSAITIEVHAKNGTLVGTNIQTLAPGQKIAKLLYEMIPATSDQIGGFVHITSSQPINSFALFGTNDGKSLSAIPPQPVTQ